MKVLLDIKDNKVDFFMEVLSSFKYVKATPITSSKNEILKGISESVEEMKLIKAGKLKARNAEDLFNEL